MTTTAQAPGPAGVEVRDGSVDRKNTAILVRRALKTAFPGVKFSVTARGKRSSAIDVSWTDGPTEGAVKAVTDVYSGIGFDGRDDSTTHAYAWLHRDGSAEWVGNYPGAGRSVTYDLDGQPVDLYEANDYRRALRVGSGVANTSLSGVDQKSPAYARGLADGATMAMRGARYVCFYAMVMTYRERSPALEARLSAAVLFLARDLPLVPDKPFSYNDKYDLAVPSSIVVGNWEGYGSDLVWRLSRLEPDVFDAVMAQEAERRAENAAIRFSDGANGMTDDGGITTGWYVTAQQLGACAVYPMLGPFTDRAVADAGVETARTLARAINPGQAAFAAFGISKVRSDPAVPLPAGRLERLPARQLALAGLA